MQPVKAFSLAGEKLVNLALEMLLLNALAATGLIAAATVATIDFRLVLKAALLLVFLPCSLIMVWAAFIQTRLYVTYWHHERGASLQLDYEARTAAYCNASCTVHFTLADVVGITQVECYRRYSASRYVIGRDYYYQVWQLRDGTELVLTCLLFSFAIPGRLLPPVPFNWVRPRFCWLPDYPLLTWRGAAFFRF